MKAIIFIIMAALCFYGCKDTKQQNHAHTTANIHTEHEHDHADHDHTDHNHEKEMHDHEHDAHDHAHEGHEHATKGQEEHNDEIIFTQEQASRTNFKVEEVYAGNFNQIIKTTGQILPAPGDESVIVATTSGVISYADNKLAAGSSVKQGTTLFYITTKNLGEGDYYARISANYNKAKAEYERAQKLVVDKIVSQKEFEAITLSYQNAKIAYDAIAGKQSGKGVNITNPLTGHIKNIAVKDGEYVTAGQAIATVSQNKRLVLRADVSERHYPLLHNISSANFQTPYDNRVYELSQLSGKLLSAGKAASENTFFIPVTFEFDNQGDVIPGSFVEVYLISSPIENAISIPLSALTNEMGYFYVYKQLDAEGYQKQEVKIGASNGRNVQILSGLQPGERIVTQGAYQVKMASASAAIPGHTHNH